MTQKKLVLIDGHSLAFRAFYALPLLQTASGLYTNAAYGFTMMLNKILQDISPDYIAVAFDKSNKTFRNELYGAYKGTRMKMPDELREQVGYIEDILNAYQIPQFVIEGYEADDTIGTLSRLADAQGDIETLIITGDRDSYQLISDKTKVMITKKGITNTVIMDEKAIKEIYGLTPPQMIDTKALMGDQSDNIPGVPGVGEKTALKLIRQFKSLEGVYQHISEVRGKVLPKKLVEYEEQARLSYTLAKIVRDIPLEVNFKSLEYSGPNKQELRKVFQRLEFNKLLEAVAEEAETQQNIKQITTVEDAATFKALVQTIRQEALLALHYIDGTDAESDTLGFYLALADDQLYHIPDIKEQWQKEWQEVLANISIKKVVHDAKAIWLKCDQKQYQLKGIVFDTALAAYLLDPSAAQYSVASLAKEYLKGAQQVSIQGQQFGQEAIAILRLYPLLEAKLRDWELTELYYQIELPLALILANMEKAGVAVKRSILLEMQEELEAGLKQAQRQIYELAGEEFNINSPKQLGLILFDKLKLPVIKKTKTGYSTAQEVLEKLALQHDLPAMIIHYRQLMKLKSTYVDGLLALVDTDITRIHSSFQQMVTATGRLSSTNPNLQNIPIRLEEGRRIRKAFVHGADYDYLLAADYSQIELRILAHMSQDAIMSAAFADNQDIHTRTAAEVFGVDPQDVDKELRRRAKAVNFGIVYGISDYGLARDLNISRAEAGEYIKNYFARYQGVKEYMDRIIVQAKQQGYVETLLHRRRSLPEINSRNYNRRSFAERTAINTPIQGTAADLIKLAMVKLQKWLDDGHYKSRMILQVHDELILEVPEEEREIMQKMVPEIMQSALQLSVPIKVDVKIGKNWYNMEDVTCQNCQK